MGKRKEKGGRRQILQLDDEAPSHNYAAGTVWPSYIPHPDQCLPGDTEEKKGQGNPLSGLLSHYMNSDDDEDDDSDDNEPTIPGASETSGHQVDEQSPKRMDVEVADFLKEIDSMKVQDEEHSDRKDSHKTMSAKSKAAESGNGMAGAAPAVPTSLWQECYDESSGYTYFWNMATNEVTWEVPAEHRLYLESLANQASGTKSNSNVATPPSAKISSAPAAPSVTKRIADSPSKATTKSEELSPSDDEGKIEPITFYGQSSSNESSDSENETPVTKGPTHYGPQLPPPKSGSSPVEFGPQLPSDLAEAEEADTERSNSSPGDVIPSSVEAQSTEVEPLSRPEPNVEMSPAEALMQSPQASSPPTTSNEVTSQIAGSESSDESQTDVECSAGPSLLHLSYLDDVDEPDSTTRPQPTVRPQSTTAESDATPQSLFIGPLHTPQLLKSAEELESESLRSPKPSDVVPAEHVESTASANHSDSEDHDRHEHLPVVAIHGPALPSTFYDDEPTAVPPGRRGFGFGKEDAVLQNDETNTKKQRQPRHSKKNKKAISFVKAETLDLTELNRHVAAEWSVATSERQSNSPSPGASQATEVMSVYGPRLPENGRTPEVKVASEIPFIGPLPPEDPVPMDNSLPANEPDPGSDLVDIDDIDEIDRALDLAFERKRLANQNGCDRNEEVENETDPQELSSDEDMVAQMSLTILERFAHAGITGDSVPHLQTLYVQTKTRLEDWRCGALDSAYLLRCLQETERETWRRGLLGAVSSSDRDCRASKRLRTDDAFLEPDTTRQNERRRKTNSVSPSSCANSVSSSTGPYLLLTAPPPPPPPTPPPDSPPPPPPDSTATQSEEMETEDVEAEAEPSKWVNSVDLLVASKPEFYTGIAEQETAMDDPSSNEPNLTPPSSIEVVVPPAIEVVAPPAIEVVAPPAIEVVAPPAMIARPPVPLPAVDLQTELSSFYSILSETDPVLPTASPPLPTVQADQTSSEISGVRVDSAATPTVAMGPTTPTATKHAAPTSNRKEKKLKKARMAPGLILKKKNIPSLVEKWRKIKQEQALAESSDEDEAHSGPLPPPD